MRLSCPSGLNEIFKKTERWTSIKELHYQIENYYKYDHLFHLCAKTNQIDFATG